MGRSREKSMVFMIEKTTSLQELGMTRRPSGPSKMRRKIGCSEDE